MKYDYNTSAGQYNKEVAGYEISMNVNINIFSKENKLIPEMSLNNKHFRKVQLDITLNSWKMP